MFIPIAMSLQNDPNCVQELIEKLEEATTFKKRGKATKRVLDILDSEQKLISWKFNEWDYAKDKIKLPSNARGLFTLLDEPKIAVRGYDKFFNINEVYSTRWEWLEQNTTGPYIVTAKENGCIILISGLEDGTIVVCSKHSTGNREDTTKNHAIAGQLFLEEQLKQLNLTTKDLALKLYELNLTAVAEFCDDGFEEHIIEYKGRDAGLYLHGLNLNKPIFETYSIEKVENFADSWGFKKIDYFIEKNIGDLKLKLDDYSKSGSYNGKEIEGFVIRCKKAEDSSDYFFKFKFEEPYLMYRQWREVTKEYITHKQRSSIKFTKHKFITNKYLDFVIPLLEEEPTVAKDYISGFGIISLRNRFLQHYGKSGPEILNQELLEELEVLNSLDALKIDEKTKFVIIPVATIGCGKTTTAQTLVNLFKNSWGIISNDDIPNGKSAKVVFVKKALEILSTKKVVVLDRNNHQYRERQQIFDDFAAFRDDYFPHDTNVQFICLNFIPEDSNDKELWDTTVQRVFERGDNHQSIKASSESAKVKGIMSGFIKRFQPVITEKEPDSKFHQVIDLNPSGQNSSLTNAEKVLSELNQKYPILVTKVPSVEEVQIAFTSALEYKPNYNKVMSKNSSQESKKNKEKFGRQSNSQNHEKTKSKEKQRKPVFFSIDIPQRQRIISGIDELIQKKAPFLNIENSSWCYLKENNRIQGEFHITLVHVNQGKRGNEHDRNVWANYLTMYESLGSKFESEVFADISLKKLIWNKKIVTILVNVLQIYHKDKILSGLGVANKHPHITVGLVSNEVKPVYSNTLAEEASFETGEGLFDNNLNVLHWEDEFVLKKLPLKVKF